MAVEIYSSAPPARRHIEVGVFEARADSGLNPDEIKETVGQLRAYAAVRGCDALFFAEISQDSPGAELAVWLYNHHDRVDRLRETCVVYTD